MNDKLKALFADVRNQLDRVELSWDSESFSHDRATDELLCRMEELDEALLHELTERQVRHAIVAE